MIRATRSCSKILLNATKYQTKPLSTVAENTFDITFVDFRGNRVTVAARPGQTLLELAQRYKVDIEGPCEGGGAPTQVRRTENWVEDTYGEGPECFYCHVQISSKYNHLLYENTDHMKDGLANFWEDEATPSSRLACQIKLDKRHAGMVVLVPDAPPADVV